MSEKKNKYIKGKILSLDKKAFAVEAKNLMFIIIGIMMYSLGFVVFILPHHIVIGGMAGFATLVYYAIGERIPVAVLMYGMNLLLLGFSFRILGRGFVFRTIFGATIVALTVGALEGYFTSNPPLITDTPVSVMMGAMVMGIGIGVYYSHHGTAGGTDIVAAIVTKLTSMSAGRVMMIVDISIVALSFLLPFQGTFEQRVQSRAESIIYGWMAIYIYSFIADRFIYQGRQTIQMIILSEKWETIADRITHETGRGVTTWEARGYWTRREKTMMIIWCRRTDLFQIYRIINKEDPSAYITEGPVRSVYGNGFDSLRIKKN